MSICDYPLCAAAKDRDAEMERHEALVNKLGEIVLNQRDNNTALGRVLVALEAINLVSLRVTHTEQDLNNLGEKIRVLENEKLVSIQASIIDIAKQRLSTAQAVIIILISGAVFGIIGYVIGTFLEKI